MDLNSPRLVCVLEITETEGLVGSGTTSVWMAISCWAGGERTDGGDGESDEVDGQSPISKCACGSGRGGRVGTGVLDGDDGQSNISNGCCRCRCCGGGVALTDDVSDELERHISTSARAKSGCGE